jgi:hypothetical protein
MKKLIIKGTIFGLIWVILLQGLAYSAKIIAPDGTTTFLTIDQQLIDDLLENKLDAEAIVVGSSHGDDIDCDQMSYKCYQLSRAWGDFFESRYYIENLVPKLPNLQAVFIPVSYFSFFWDNASIGKLDVRRSQMYTVVPGWRFLPGDVENFTIGRLDKYLPLQTVVREDHWKSVIYALLAGEVGHNEMDALAQSCEFHSVEELEKAARLRAIDTIRLSDEVKANRVNIHEDAYSELVRIIEFLQNQHGIRIIFFTPPYYKTYTETYADDDPEAIQMMRSSMQQLQDEYGIEYYDFSLDAEFTGNHELFKDSDHLNLCGMALFSRKLDESVANEMDRR